MLQKKFIFILLVLSIVLISFSAVSAAELNETIAGNQNSDNELISVDNNDEKYESACSEGVNNGIKYKFEQTGNYYGETKLHVSLTNATTNKGISGKSVGIYVDDELWKELKTDSKGLIDVNFKKSAGEYDVEGILHDNSNLKLGILPVKISKIPTNFKLSQNSAYYKDTRLTFNLNNMLNGKGVSNEKISLKFSNGKTAKVTTNSKGIATYDVDFKPGTYSLKAVSSSKNVAKNEVNLKFTIGKTYLKTAAKDISTTYNSAKKLKIKVTNYFTNKAMKNIKINLKIFTGKKSKTVTLKTDSNGIAKYDVSQLDVGSHKIVIANAEKYCEGAQKTVTAKISKAKLNIQAPEITTDANTSKSFKITVKNKETGKAMKNIKVNVKVYTGKNYKTYNLKTNSNGQSSISTQGMSVSAHNVAISVKADKNINAATSKSTITINQ